MLRLVTSPLILSFLGLLLACAKSGDGASSPDAVEAPPIVLWRPFSEPPPTHASWFQMHKDVEEFLVFCYHRKVGQSDKDPSCLGDYAVGNGYVFAELGLTFPLNTIHGMAGPTYSRGDRFYGDLAVLLSVDGKTVPFDEEWVCANRSLPTVVTVARAGEIYLSTVDLAPISKAEPRAVHRAVWRKVLVANQGAAPTGTLGIVVRAAVKQEVDSPGVVEKKVNGERHVFFLGQNSMPSPEGLTLTTGRLDAYQEFEADLLIATAAQGTPTSDLVKMMASESFESLAAETREVYQAFEASYAKVETPDPAVNDFFTNLMRTLFIQVSAQGGASPMSRYSDMWTRDLSGFVRPLLAMGAFELASRLLEYYRLAACKEHDIRNSYGADLELAPSACENETFERPDKMTGRCAAEGPSYLPIMYGWLHDASAEDVSRALPLLRRSVFGQRWNEEYLLPFSGDETFRAAMNAVFGLPLEHPHQDESLSLVSGYVLASAALRLASLERLYGNADVSEQALALARAVEKATRERFSLEGGCRAALINRSDGLLSPPYEDALLTGPWAGPPFGEDEAELVVSCLLSRVPGDENLIVVSPLHPSYKGVLPILGDEGMYTGMLPGYTLRAMTMASHPKAEAAFNALRPSLSPSGNYGEYMIVKNHCALQLAYDPIGLLADYTARYRPWEGGINLEAAFYYLTGYEPDAEAGRVVLKPHLPNGWPSMTVRQMRFLGSRFDLAVERIEGHGLSLTVKVTSQAGFEVQFVTEGMPRSAQLEGMEVKPEGVVVRSGVEVLTWPKCRVEGGKACVLEVRI